MKKQHYIFINIAFFSLTLFSAAVVFQFLTGFKPLDVIANIGKQSSVQVQTQQCSSREPLQNLSGAGSDNLKRLAAYQQACHSFATDTMMIFFGMANNPDEARVYATEDAKILRTFADAKVRPLVIYEPTDKTGVHLDFELFANGTFNPTTDAYFAQLKQEGITDAELGIINPFPEANLPYWNNNQPNFFSPAVNNYLTIARAHFPEVATSILLNSATYDLDDFNWENGDYNSLLPYMGEVQPGLVTYAGLQGFPWISRQGGAGVIFNAEEFLQPTLLQEMADKLQTKNVWFNTGTFSQKYTLDPADIRTISAAQRKEILMTIKQQAIMLKEADYKVAVSIFAEDKSSTAEETNWSYWQNDPFTSPDAVVLTEFIKNLNDNELEFWLFDS